MSALPWMKFYPADWRSDPALRMCSLAARGLWMEMLALMHDASPRGSLLVNGKEVTMAQLAMLVGCSPEEAEKLCAELGSAGVFSRKKNGIIYSRRIEKDENKSRKNRENGKLGGNPTLSKDTENQESLNHQDNGEDKAQKLDSRSQKPEARKEDEFLGGLISADAHLESRLREAAGWEGNSRIHYHLAVTGPIVALMQAGADLDLDVLPIIRRDAHRCQTPNWNYFTKAIAQARDDRIRAATIVSPESHREKTNGGSSNHSGRKARSYTGEALAALGGQGHQGAEPSRD